MKAGFVAGVALVALFVAVGSARGAEVSATYQGTVEEDSGLGLLGQVMTVEFTYDDTTAGLPSSNSIFYANLVTDARVTIGANEWSFEPAQGSGARLYDDRVLFVAVEDRFTLGGVVSGPDLGTGASAFSLTIILSDTDPAGAPDGLLSEALPDPAPRPEDFAPDPGGVVTANELALTWSTGPPETGNFEIIARNVTTATTPAVPIPGAATLLLALLLLLAAIVAVDRRGRRPERHA